MSYFQQLVKTYDNALGLNKEDLWPLDHVQRKSQLVICVDGDGNFMEATKSDEDIFIPATEDSAGRTSGAFAHPLCDTIRYVAGDYSKYFAENGHFDEYFKQLEDWRKNCDGAFPDARLMLEAVLKYVAQKSVIADLARTKVLTLDGDGKVAETGSNKYLVRWEVQIPGRPESKVWESTELRKSWRAFYNSTKKGRGTHERCYITGEDIEFCAKNAPAYIRHRADKTKLISSNDTDGFTFRGRFENAAQACAVGHTAAEKAHSALRWLIKNQGFRNDTQVIVAWAVSNAPIPKFWQSSEELFDEDDPFSDDAFESQEANDNDIYVNDVGAAYAKKLNEKLRGYKRKLDEYDNVVVMALDSTSSVPQGRLSVTYYGELKGSDFLERVEAYHTRYAWRQRSDKGGEFIGAPSLKEIAKAAFSEKIDEPLLKSTVSRLLPIIIEGAQFPRDLLRQVYNRAVRPQTMEETTEERKTPVIAKGKNSLLLPKKEEESFFEKTLGIACGLFKGSYVERGYEMALEKERTSRDYLYGRLFAAADGLEGAALRFADENDKKRETTAMKLMTRFAERPFETWKHIETNLSPYRARLKSRAGDELFIYDKLIDTICNAFDAGDFSDNSPLSAEFLLGFHCQRYELRNGYDKSGAEKETNGNTEDIEKEREE